MNNEELINVYGGGFSFTATWLNAIARTINTIMDIGRSVGTSLRMIFSGTKC